MIGLSTSKIESLVDGDDMVVEVLAFGKPTKLEILVDFVNMESQETPVCVFPVTQHVVAKGTESIYQID